MLGYNDLRDPSVSGFFRFLARVGDNGMKMQIVKIGFGETKMKRVHFDVEEGRLLRRILSAQPHIQQRARIRLKPCPLSDTILFIERLFYSHSMVAGGLDVMS